MNAPRHAYIDESYRPVGPRGLGTYLFAAVTLRAEDEPLVREQLDRLRGRARLLHWNEDRPQTRRRVLTAVALMPLAGLTIYRGQVPRGRTERMRQHALWNLTAELRDRDVHDLTLEARERQMNKRDEETLANIARTKVAGERFRYRFVGKYDEPLLWLADYVAGAVGESLCRDDASYLAHLPGGSVAVIEITPPR